MAIVWLATYSWVGDGQKTAADWLMVLVDIVGAWIGTSVTAALDPRTITDGSWLLMGIQHSPVAWSTQMFLKG